MSKGSAQRPTDKEKFDQAFERIFGKKPPPKPICQRPENCTQPFCNCEVKHD